MRDLSKKLFNHEFVRECGQLVLPLFCRIKKRKSGKLKSIIPLVKSLPLVKAERLPVSYDHWPCGTLINTKIRVDNIPASLVSSWSWAIFSLVGSQDIYFEDESKGYAFIDFEKHIIASRFLEKFDNKKITGTDMVYQLSWAPFYRNPNTSFSHVKFEKTSRSDPFLSRTYEVMKKIRPDGGMVAEMRAFHESFKNDNKNVPIELGADEGWPGVIPSPDDGHTTILYLMMVDPCVEEGVMKGIFEQYGKCTIYLPNNKGFGNVKFVDRDCAEQAFCDLERLFKVENVCHLVWGVDLKEELVRKELERVGKATLERGTPGGDMT